MRTSTHPEPEREDHAGYWISDEWPAPASSETALDLAGPPTGRPLDVRADVGTAAWIDCAGHLPWGLSTDQRYDDVVARRAWHESLTRGT